MPPQGTARPPAAGAAQTLVLVVFLLLLGVIVGGRFSADVRDGDFPDFYAAARMLAEGHGHQLYDVDVQRQYQARDTGRVGTLYIHPPFEAVLYLAVAWLPLKCAYLLWSLMNLALFAAGCRLMASEVLRSCNWRLLFAASLTFVPLALCIQQGQDSLVLFFLILLAFKALRRNLAFAAGCWLGLGLFKFELVLPMLVALFLTCGSSAKKSIAKGFCSVTVALAVVSAAISGSSVFRDYPAFLWHLRARPFAGIFPQAMANLRGLVYVIFRNDQSIKAITVLSISSVLTLLITVIEWKDLRLRQGSDATAYDFDNFDRAFANTVLFALLVSYHLNPHDLAVLLLPLVLILDRAVRRRSPPADRIMAGLVAILFLPPVHLWALRGKAYSLISVPLLILFVINAFSERKSTQSGIS